ncbi:efflux RND transporter periplasmic adaptor subunit [uncultured Nitratireductor sp.]|uniref:efflux RND transporter periplasmic adaptor subunit n=1 Tax=uncultured Nitratireductor sp. TaxID=520953 RepID=UPI0025E6FE61|nr:efflux RND transporter periplasmic adaptor subunit [uncultured Nitratireductor sp.]
MKTTAREPDGFVSTIAQGSSPTAKPPRKRRCWPLLLPVGGLLAAGIWFFSGIQTVQTGATYQSRPVERGNLVIRVATTAMLRPRTQIEISSELKGTVQRVPVRQNQRVSRGDVLAQLDATIFRHQVDRAAALADGALASLADARITQGEAERKLTRAKALRSRNALSQQTLEDTQAEFDRAVNRVAAATADLAAKRVELTLKRFDLNRTTIRSPIDGVVLARKAEPGRTIFATSDDGVLFVLAEDLERMELIARINEADIGAIAKGQQATFTVDAYPDQIFSATIRDVSFAHIRENNVVTYEANLDVRNGDLKLRPGMTASVSIGIGEANEALLIPASALRYRPHAFREDPTQDDFEGTWDTGLVHVLDKDAPKPVRVRLGARDWEKVEVLSGLAEGQKVITGDTADEALQ